jgi:hypothetical protein
VDGDVTILYKCWFVSLRGRDCTGNLVGNHNLILKHTTEKHGKNMAEEPEIS